MDTSPLTCTAEQLYTMVSSAPARQLRMTLSNPAMSAQHIVVLLRNPHVTSDMVELVCQNNDWIENHAVQLAVANCVRTPHTLALRVLQLLLWNDLMKVAGNFRLSPRLRRAAENHLRDRVPELTLGERMTLARTGPRAVVPFLRDDTETRVISALLRNPHLIEEDVIRIINNEIADPDVLAAIGSDYKWSQAYPIRLALARSSRTPLSLVLSLLSKLQHQDLRQLLTAAGTPELVRRGAQRILDGRY